jgi:hypothetical protein
MAAFFTQPATCPEAADEGVPAALAIVTAQASALAIRPPNTNRVLNLLITRYPSLQSDTNKRGAGHQYRRRVIALCRKMSEITPQFLSVISVYRVPCKANQRAAQATTSPF